jgi:hypothetical protein
MYEEITLKVIKPNQDQLNQEYYTFVNDGKTDTDFTQLIANF